MYDVYNLADVQPDLIIVINLLST